MTAAGTGKQPKRGRPRDTAASRAILGAFFELIAEVGYAGTTMDAIAARAGVAKTTIYRRWATKDELVVAAHGLMLRDHPMPDTGALRSDLLALVTSVTEVFSQWPMNRAVAAMIGEMAHNEELATLFREAVIEQRIALVVAIWERAANRGEVAIRASWRMYAQMLIAPLIVRLVIIGEPPDARFGADLVEAVLRAAGYRASGATPALSAGRRS